MKILKPFSLIIAGICLMSLVSCSQIFQSTNDSNILTRSEIIGVYSYKFDIGTAYIEIKDDSTYCCKFVGNNGTVTTTDSETYQFDESDTLFYPGYYVIHLENFYINLMKGFDENSHRLTAFPTTINRSMFHTTGNFQRVCKRENGDIEFPLDEDIGVIYRKVLNSQ